MRTAMTSARLALPAVLLTLWASSLPGQSPTAEQILEPRDPQGALRTELEAIEYLQTSVGNVAEIETRLARAERFALDHGLDSYQLRYLRINQLRLLGGDLGEAYRLALELERSAAPSLRSQQKITSLLAALSQELGRYEEARHLATKLVGLATSPAGSRGSEANARNLLAGIHAGLCTLSAEDGCPEARHHYELGLRAARESGWIVHRLLWGLAGFETGPARQELLEECVAIAPPGRDTWYLCRAELAAVVRADQPRRARQLEDQLLFATLEADDPWLFVLIWPALLELAEGRWPERHVELSELVLELVEAIRASHLEWSDQASMLHTWADPFYVTAGKLLAKAATGDRLAQAKAHRVGEWLRARVLLEAIGPEPDRPLSGAGTAGRAELGRRQAMLRLQCLLTELLGAPARRPIYEQALAQIQATSPGFGAGRATATAPSLRQRQVATVDDLRASLAENEAMLLYQLAPEHDARGRFAGGSWLTVVDAIGARTYRLNDMAGFAPLLSAVVAPQDPAEIWPGHLERLYDELLAPAIAELPATVRHLYVVPDGALYLLPFAALRPAVDRQPLAASYQITLAASATLWQLGREMRPPAAAAALVLADPRLASEDPNLPSDPIRRWLAQRSAELGPLPAAREEGAAVLRNLGSESRMLVGQEASERALRETDLQRYSILHFAAHAASGAGGDRVGVLLASDPIADDGLLTPGEIARLPLDEHLVVLAACSSAGGERLRGEGVMSLARSFLAAGARTVIGSLQEISDTETQRFFDRFYQRLAVGDSAGTALHTVQREHLAGGSRPGPWSHLVLLGDPSWSLEPPSLGRRTSGRQLLWPLALGLLAIGTALLWRDLARAKLERR